MKNNKGKKMFNKNQSKRIPLKRKSKKSTINNKLTAVWGRLNKKFIVLVCVLAFAGIGYVLYSSSRAGTDVNYVTGVITGVDGKQFDTRQFAPKAKPQLYLAYCDVAQKCLFRFYIVHPTKPGGQNWTSYTVTSPNNASFKHVVSTTADVNGAFDTIPTADSSMQRKNYKVRFTGSRGNSEFSATVYMPAYVKPTPVPTPVPKRPTPTPPISEPTTPPIHGPTPTPTLTVDPAGPHIPNPPYIRPTPIVDPDDPYNPVDPDNPIEPVDPIDIGDLGDIFDMADLSSLDLSSILDSDPSLAALESNLGGTNSSSSTSNTSNTNTGQSSTLSALGYKTVLFCVNKVPKTAETYKVAPCGNSSYVFLGVTGTDQSIKKEQFTYKIVINGSKVKFDDITGCRLKTLMFKSQTVSWCGAVFGDKSLVEAVKDSLQNRLNKILSKITGNNFVYRIDARAHNFNAEKASLDTRSYTITTIYKGYKPMVSNGTIKFKISESAIEKLIIAAQKKDCQKAGGTYNSSNAGCSTTTASAKALSNSTSYPSSTSKTGKGNTTSRYYYDDPSQIMLENLIGVLKDPSCFLNGSSGCK